MQAKWRLNGFLDRCQAILASPQDLTGPKRHEHVRWLLNPLPSDPTKVERLLVKAILVEIECRLPATNRETRLIRILEAEGDATSLLRALLGSPNCLATTRSPRASLSAEKVARALATIEACHADPGFGLERAAQSVRLSRWHLSRLITDHTGRSFSAHLLELRMSRAAGLLRQSVLSIKEIAGRVGYTNTTQFDRNFKASFGVTPIEYRVQGMPTASKSDEQQQSATNCSCRFERGN